MAYGPEWFPVGTRVALKEGSRSVTGEQNLRGTVVGEVDLNAQSCWVAWEYREQGIKNYQHYLENLVPMLGMTEYPEG